MEITTKSPETAIHAERMHELANACQREESSMKKAGWHPDSTKLTAKQKTHMRNFVACRIDYIDEAIMFLRSHAKNFNRLPINNDEIAERIERCRNTINAFNSQRRMFVALQGRIGKGVRPDNVRV